MNDFLKTANIYIEKPQVTNSKIFGSKVTKENDEIKRIIIFKESKLDNIFETLTIKDNSILFDSNLGKYEILFEKYKFNIKIYNNFQKHDVINENFLTCILEDKLNYWINQSISYKMPSLSQIDIGEYKVTYDRLKNEYGAKLTENWEEKTDPEKFVYEDIAIASYLMTLWKNEKDPVKFIDIGCGNGLLVYLLNEEGYSGIGIDLRARNIWQKYPTSIQTKLQVGVVTPDSRYSSEYNWFIGNHSDELTPWIPVIARYSNDLSNVFLLPCCPFDFFTKFNNIGSLYKSKDESRYDSYKKFVNIIMEKCGFVVVTDSLRIPSTKKFCLIGRTEKDLDKKLINQQIEELISSRKPQQNTEFEARPKEIINRNCTYLTNNFKEKVICLISEKLLSYKNVIITDNNKQWNKGGKLPLKDLVALLDSDLTQQMKNEHGGLQTLLRNQHQIFKVTEGMVEFRIQNEDTPSPKRQRLSNAIQRKIKSCWFYLNHPNGCPLSESECNYIHEKSADI